MKKWVGDPEDPEDLKMLEERSPIKYIDNIKCPLLVVQGANDIRVVKSESDQVVKRLRDKGIEVEYIVFDDEGHLFSKETNLKHGIKKTIEFLIKHLLKSPYPD
jgi:dipeptidyl aminopeptidase/acylaminoacyl peptidase